jgi:hypothetical protein
MRYGRLAILQVVVAVLQLKLYASTLNSKIHRTKYHLCVSMIAELPYIHRLKSVVLRQQRIKNVCEFTMSLYLLKPISEFEKINS